MRLSKICLWGMALTTVATLVAPVVATQMGTRSRPEIFFGAGLIVLLLFGVTLGAAAVIDNGRAKFLMNSGIVAGVVAAALWITAMFVARGDAFLNWQRVFTWPGVYACFVTVTGVLLLVRTDEPWHRGLRGATIVMLGVLGFQIAMATSLHPGYGDAPSGQYEENAARLGAALALIAAGGVAGTLVGAWLTRVEGGGTPTLEYWIRCPRCGREQSMTTGGASCGGCGLAVRTEVT